MRARVYSNGGNSTGGFTFNGGQLTGALILAGNPSDPLEAAAKQYVDSSLVNLNASNLTSGILPAGRLPVFTGDIVKPAGSSSINLAPIGITASDYVKPTVDAKGRVTAGGVITEADLPNISWNKVSTGKPTTVEGYGITDALTTAGGTLSGFLTFNGSITGTMQAVTKQYVDVTLSSSTGIAIGDIIRKPYGTTPAGFLKCNGALVSKTTYNALYATINDRFNKSIQASLGKPWCNQYAINEIQNKDINNWTVGTSIPAPAYVCSVIVTKNRVYILGGYNGSVHTTTVYTATINTDGTLGTWTTGTALPGVLNYAQVVITKNRVYLLGGETGSSSTAVTTTVYTAPINSDGTLGTWVTGTSLPAGLSCTQAIVTNSRVYLLGGWNGTSYASTVYTATISSDGVLGTWSTGTALPAALGHSQLICTKNRVYLLGGFNGTTASSVIYTAVINSDGTLGTWSTSGSLPGPLYASLSYTTKERVYLFNGNNGSGYISTSYTVPINSDGTLGTWSTGTSLPGILSGSQLFVTKNRIHLLGGYNGSTYVSTVYSAIINGGLNDYSSYYATDDTNYLMPGSGKPWQQQYQINNSQTADISGWSTTTSLPGVLTYSQAIVTKNRVYMLGGKNETSYVSTVYTAPINADGTLGTWTTGTSLPGTLGASQAIITKNRVYLLGGYLGNSNWISTVYTAPINVDGTLGTWTTGTSLPGILSDSQVIVTRNRVYLAGGYNGSGYSSTVYTAPINTDGTLGTWSTGIALPTPLSWSQVIVTKNRVYLCGGYNGTAYSSIVYTATINSDGLIGAWTTGTSLPGNTYASQAIITKNRVYLLGGISGSLYTSTVYTAPINADGTLGTWTIGTSLPTILSISQAIVTKDHVYLLGGYTNTNHVSTVYMASILGGENDYSPYYDGTITPMTVVDPSTTFALPDLSQSEKFDTVSYIKY